MSLSALDVVETRKLRRGRSERSMEIFARRQSILPRWNRTCHTVDSFAIAPPNIVFEEENDEEDDVSDCK